MTSVFRKARALLARLGSGEANKKLAEKNEALKRAHRELTERDREISHLRESFDEPGVGPENIVWLFCTARSGSTWLSAMMDEMDGYTRWHEPLVGALFGQLYQNRAARRNDEHFILGGDRRRLLDLVRRIVLEGAGRRFPELADGGYLVVKEPQGSMGASLLMEALPESRMILLVRDPRDVVASNLDAHKKGNWTEELARRGGVEKQNTLADDNPDKFVRLRALRYLKDIGESKQAYEAHEGRKTLVRYEDLRPDTLDTMKRIYSELELPVDEEKLAAVVEKHAWENIPEDKKGEGKFHRKGTPGGWREDLTEKQIDIVEEVAAPLLRGILPGYYRLGDAPGESLYSHSRLQRRGWFRDPDEIHRRAEGGLRLRGGGR